MRRAVVVLACALASACGGRLAPIDGGADGDNAIFDAGGDAGADGQSAADAGDASVGGDAADGAVECSWDASEDDPCTPPADDLLYADPDVVNVAGASYGLAKFVASGPWVSDPGFYMWFAGSSLPLQNVSMVQTYGSPQSLIFLVPGDEIGQTLTFSVAGHAGNITKVADLTVHVTNCQPWPPSMVCGGQTCNYQPDDCGGVVSCGMCPPSAPYCFLRQCVTTMPKYCPPGQGTDGHGGCIPCEQTRTCQDCPAGSVCAGVQDVCLCASGG
jgi:hypothetical protein